MAEARSRVARPSSLPVFRLVIFDFDGTLADTFPWFARTLGSVADRYRIRRVEAGDAERLRQLSTREIMRELAIPAWKLPLIARHMRRLAARDSAQLGLVEGVGAMLRRLHAAGIRLAIVSSNAESTIRRVLGPELAALVEHYGCGASAFGKAARMGRATRAAGVSRDAVIYIGDEIRDQEAAAQAGVAFGAVAWGYTRLEALAQRRPAMVFHTCEELGERLTAPSIDQPRSTG